MMRLKVRGSSVVEQERIDLEPYGRVRDVTQGPDGWLYVVADLPQGSIIRVGMRSQ
jgi:glucose/arabinose dehydrogenase